MTGLRSVLPRVPSRSRGESAGSEHHLSTRTQNIPKSEKSFTNGSFGRSQGDALFARQSRSHRSDQSSMQQIPVEPHPPASFCFAPNMNTGFLPEEQASLHERNSEYGSQHYPRLQINSPIRSFRISPPPVMPVPTVPCSTSHVNVVDGGLSGTMHPRYEDDDATLHARYNRHDRGVCNEAIPRLPRNQWPNNRKHPHESGNNKHSPRRRSTNILVDDISSSDEDDGEDYISKLQIVVHRRKLCSGVTWDFKRVRQRRTHHDGWMCSGTTKLLPVTPESERMFRSCVAYNKQKAKKKVAKVLFLALQAIAASRAMDIQAEEETPSAPEPVSPGQNISKVKRMNQLSAITALFQLRQADVLEYLDFEFDPIADSHGSKWECAVIMGLPGDRIVKVTHVASQKRLAKQIVAQKGFDRLKELQVRDVDKYTIRYVADSDEKTFDKFDISALREVPKDIVQTSDAESDTSDAAVLDKQNNLQLPEKYHLSIPTTDEECDNWFRNNLSPSAHVGIYIDSPSARNTFKEDGGKVLIDQGHADTEYPFICISTATHGIVLRQSKAGNETIRNQPLDKKYSYWVPPMAREVFRDPLIRKHGYHVDEGVMLLASKNGIDIDSVNEIASTSLAVNGLGTKRAGLCVSFTELTKQWLDMKYSDITMRSIWSNVSDIPVTLANGEMDDIAVGILSSYANLMIREQIALRSKRKKLQLFRTAAEFDDLACRLLQPT